MTQISEFISLILILFILGQLSLSLDYFEACKPRLCGGLSITYPLYIQGLQEPFCGYPGYQVSCNSQNHVIINLSNNSYVIQNIFYDVQSVNVVNTAFVDSSFNCTPVIHNLTVDSKMFKFIRNHSEIFFLQNCLEEAKRSIIKYNEVSCVNHGEVSKILMAYAQDINLEKLVGKCGRVMSVPYEGPDDSDIAGVLKRGLVLQWTVSGCSECAHSGGQCGYNKTSSQTVCFCPDGPPSQRCTS